MKNIMKQSGKALGFFLFYLVVGQIIVAFIVQFIMGMIASNQAMANGIPISSQEEAVAIGTEYYAQHMGIDLASRAAFLILAFLIFFLIRKKNYLKEISFEKTSGKKIVAALFGAAFVIFFVNGLLNLLTPQDQLQSFQDASSVLYTYPLWQAILANALLVPIAEEIVFRGLMFSRLQKAMPNIAVALITSISFGLVHGQLIWMLFAFVVGLVLSFVRIKTGSIMPTIIMHVLINTYATLLSYQVIVIPSYAVFYTLFAIGGLCIFPCIFLMLKACKEEQTQPAEMSVSTIVM
ncbi:MAG: CPBP family intramembrane metalloprotease [Lachnospiraceae bacterium]|nr:CPBP family intramembrane metalloprotease [Lachnospiraceae bacterium]